MNNRLCSLIAVALFLTRSIAFADDKVFDSLPDIGPVGASNKLATNLQIDVEKNQVVGITSDAAGVVYFSTMEDAFRLQNDEPPTELCTYKKLWNGLIAQPEGHLLACERANKDAGGRIIDFSIADKSLTPITTKRFNNPIDLIADGDGGLYVTDIDANLKGTVYYLEKYRARNQEWRTVANNLPGARSVRLSPDEKTLYVVLMGDKKMMSYSVSGPGRLGEPRVFCELTQFPNSKYPGASSGTVDAEGNVYYATEAGLQAFNSQGKPHGTIKMPDSPTNVILGIDGRKSLYVTTPNGLYRFPMKVDGIKGNF